MKKRWYNGTHSKVMDKIYDGLVARYGSIEELQKACPDWSIFSLYLTRSVNVALQGDNQ